MSSVIMFDTYVGKDGCLSDPFPLPFRDRDVRVMLQIPESAHPTAILPNGKTAVEDFLDTCTGLVREMNDEEVEVERLAYLREKRKNHL
ncbi:MAG: hypothetical protein ACRC10_08575 [Thermoguttaceae bacterium]